MIYAANVPRSIGFVIAITVFVVAALFVLYRAIVILTRKDDEVGSEIDLAPNRRPYYSDAELEGPKLDRSLLLGLLALTVCSVTLPLYWIGEPGRLAGAEVGFENRAVSRGEEAYAASCTNCHGANGQAGAAAVTLTDDNGDFLAAVQWTAPALNTVFSRFDADEVRFILNFGRNGVMPAWGAPGGGPLTTQEIDNLVAYLQEIQLPLDEIEVAVGEGVSARAAEAITVESDLGDELDAAEAAVTEIEEGIDAADDPEAEAEARADELADALAAVEAVREQIDASVPALVEEFIARATNPDAADPSHPDHGDYLKWGEYLFTNKADGGVYACARCHTAGWSYQAAEVTGLSGQPLQDGYMQGGGAHGPNLRDSVEITRFPDEAAHAAFVATLKSAIWRS